MGYTLTIHIGANSFDFQANDFGVIADSALGKSPVSRKETKAAQQHGSTDRGFTLSPRVFSMGFIMKGKTFRQYWDMRDKLVRVFKSTEDLFQMRWTFDNGDVRSLDCATVEGLAFPSSRRSGFADRGIVTLKANNPTFYDPVENSIIFSIGGGSEAFTIPLPIPWPIGVSTLDVTKTIAYPGSWRASPIVKIIGPITDPIIQNVLTDEKLDFTGFTVPALYYYEIDTRDNFKTVIKVEIADPANTANKISELSDDSDLGTYHLETPVLDNATRDNDIQVTGTSVTAATEVFFRYKTRYEGM